MAEEVSFKLSAEASDLLNELVKAGKISEEVATKMAVAFDKSIDKQVKSAKRLTRERKKAQANALKEASDGFRKFAGVAGGETGRITTALLDAGEGAAGFTKALGPVGLAATAAALAVVGIGLAVNAAVKKFDQMIASSKALIEDAETLARLSTGPLMVTPEAVDNIRDAEFAMQALNDIGDQFTVLLTSELAPAFIALVAAVLDAVDAMDQFAGNNQRSIAALDELLSWVGPLGIAQRVLAGFSGESADALRDQAAAAREATTVFEDYGPTLDQAGKSEKSLADERRAATEALRAAEVAVRDRLAAEQQLSGIIQSSIQGEQKIRLELKQRFALIDELEKKTGDAALADAARDAALSASSEQMGKLEATKLAEEEAAHAVRVKMANDELDAEEARALRFAEIDEAKLERADRIAQGQIEAGFMVADMSSRIADSIAANAERGSAAQKAAAVASFIIQKASALGQIAVNTAAAAARALAEGGLFAGPPGAALMIALGAAQAALVIAEPVPSFHLGGSPSTAGSAAQPDVVQAQVLTNEKVLTAEQQRAQADGGGGRLMSVQMGHEVFNRGIQTELRTPGSALASAMRRGETPGRGSYRGG